MDTKDQENCTQDRQRICTILTEDEKDDLQILAWKSGRSMSGYLRRLVVAAIEDNKD